MKQNNSSYNQIIKSTSIFGGSQIITVIIGIVRAKIVAILLGTVGVGFIGIYQSIIDMVRMGSTLGIDTGGIREIAKDNTIDNETQLHRIITAFNRWFQATALLGFFVCIALCFPISLWAFDSYEYALPIALLSVCVYLTILSTGKSVVLQAMRQISYMAQATIWGSLFGLIVALPLIYFLRLDGIILAFITGSLILYFCTDFYYRKLNLQNVEISNKEAFKAGINTLKLGLFIVAAGIINTVSMFLVRAFLTRNIGLDAVGLFQSAWTITNVYLGLILKSMGSDFFPRLSAIANDKEEVKTLVNEQIYIVLTIASPIIVIMLLFSDLTLSILYSSKFTGANTLLEWQIVGSFFKVLSWPIAFIMLAKNKGSLFLLSEILFYAIYLLVSFMIYPQYGLESAGIGYLIAYLFYLPIVAAIGWKTSRFIWNKAIIKMATINLILISIAFYSAYSDLEYSIIVGIIAVLCSLVYAYYNLQKVFRLDDLKGWFKKR